MLGLFSIRSSYLESCVPHYGSRRGLWYLICFFGSNMHGSHIQGRPSFEKEGDMGLKNAPLNQI